MDYITNSKNRKLKNKIRLVFTRLGFNIAHLSRSSRVIGVGIILSILSLFLNWFSVGDTGFRGNAFSIHVGYIGYIIMGIVMVISFLLFSDREKEKLKTKAHLTFSDHTIIISGGITLFLLTVVVFNCIRGFNLFYQNILIGDGLTFQCIASVFIMLGGFLYYREQKKELLSTIYVENTQAYNSLLGEYDDILGKKDPDKKNMTLPL